MTVLATVIAALVAMTAPFVAIRGDERHGVDLAVRLVGAVVVTVLVTYLLDLVLPSPLVWTWVSVAAVAGIAGAAVQTKGT